MVVLITRLNNDAHALIFDDVRTDTKAVYCFLGDVVNRDLCRARLADNGLRDSEFASKLAQVNRLLIVLVDRHHEAKISQPLAIFVCFAHSSLQNKLSVWPMSE